MPSKKALISIAIGVLAAICVMSLLLWSRSGSTAHVGGTTFPAQHHNWVTGTPIPANVLMHWQEYTCVCQASTSAFDPSLNLVETVDHWVQTDTTSQVVFVRTTFRTRDGRLIEDDYDTPTRSVLVHGNMGGIYGGKQDWCYSDNPQRQPFGYTFPWYLDNQGIQRDHFVEWPGMFSKPIPQLSLDMPDATPTSMSAIPTQAQVWVGHGVPAPGLVETAEFDTDSTGRIIIADIQRSDPSGTVRSDQWYSIGRIYLYPGTTPLPAAVLALPIQLTKGCNSPGGS